MREQVCVYLVAKERERENYDRMGVSKKEMEYQGVFRKVLKERKRKKVLICLRVEKEQEM